VVIRTGQGEAHVLIDRPGTGPAPSSGEKTPRPRFLLALTHGSGGGVETADLLAVRDAALALGGAVTRVVQPYRVRGARSPGSAARQDAAWVSVLAAVREMLRTEMPGTEMPGTAGAGVPGETAGRGSADRGAAGPDAAGWIPLIQGGRSNGARVACRTAGQVGAGAVIALAFPLHPPGRPDRSRRDELRTATAAGADVLVVNGSRDPFGIPAQADAGAPAGTEGTGGSARIVVLEGEGHQLSRDPGALHAVVSSWLSGWVHDRGAWPANSAASAPRH
jgi:uncharacterized protein